MNCSLWAGAAKHLLPDDSVSALLTGPPYPDLPGFFYVWLRRTRPGLFTSLLRLLAVGEIWLQRLTQTTGFGGSTDDG